jgi:hypothetical protein
MLAFGRTKYFLGDVVFTWNAAKMGTGAGEICIMGASEGGAASWSMWAKIRRAVEGGAVDDGEEVEELVVMVSGEAGNDVGVDSGVESGPGGGRVPAVAVG